MVIFAMQPLVSQEVHFPNDSTACYDKKTVFAIKKQQEELSWLKINRHKLLDTITSQKNIIVKMDLENKNLIDYVNQQRSVANIATDNANKYIIEAEVIRSKKPKWYLNPWIHLGIGFLTGVFIAK